MLDKRQNVDPVLVVDLDGTLLRSDLLYESFWSAFGKDWRCPFLSANALRSGRAALKAYLADASDIDTTLLPYDPDVIAYVEAWRERGGRTALVTASDQSIASRIADHLGIFDEVHGSDGTLNLKGPNKAKFLTEHFGETGYAYMADHAVDLPVWQHAKKVITVNAPTSLRGQAEKLGPEFEHLTTSGSSAKAHLKALRPHQWLKNSLVFLPMFAAHQLDIITVLESFFAFVAFSLIASSVYVLNDLLDLAADRAHPRKKKRPFASGAIPIANGTWMAPGLLLAGVLISLALGWKFALVMLGYYVMTTAYSLHLKRRMVVDICVLAGLYTVRIVAGGVATGIPLSVWLLAFSIFLFFSLAAVKRQAELVDSAQRGKLSATGRGYHVDDVPIVSMMAIGSGYVSVLVMALYLNSPAVMVLYPYPAALWGICLVLLYWISRMVMVTHRGNMHDDPVVYATKDRISQICLLLVLVFAAGGMLI
ncbi:Decaprenyl-phosphate phosphoribosyltransferase [Hartmannibacter diazotrophicus]|uniref:Decaprenyl-phosphate phosphoribosyltransferase n=1 Tax=Hartmannibacter diazotrophicus TaxID=1482074 RepID=A0A2C9DDZ1_9HYPH|nr:UbiA family prenyltransferase [Hartmannibacter diazotrophicus]SON57981.1 Decaprenyl-phosphate phosphoribosyltransferase [Hartmannibacter diazotrophicus]